MLQNKTVIDRFKKILLWTVILFFITACCGITIRGLFPDITNSTIYRGTVFLLLSVIVLGYIATLVYLYKTAVILKDSGRLKINPILLVVLAVLATPVLFIINIIIFVVIWQKSNKYIEETSK